MAEADGLIGERPVKGPGRPRDPSVETAILRAAADRLVEGGYSRITIGDVAADAGVTRPTVYRRWASKQELIVAALEFNLQEERRAHPVAQLDRLPPADALKQALQHAFPTDRGLKAIGNVLIEAEHNPELVELIRRHAIAPRLSPLLDTLRRLREEGVLDAAVDLEVVADMMIGSYYASYLRREGSATHSTDTVVETVWPLIAARP